MTNGLEDKYASNYATATLSFLSAHLKLTFVGSCFLKYCTDCQKNQNVLIATNNIEIRVILLQFVS